MQLWWIPLVHISLLIALNYIALKLRTLPFVESYGLFALPILSGTASIMMAALPHVPGLPETDLRFAPMLMAGLLFGWTVGLASTVMPIVWGLLSSDSSIVSSCLLAVVLPAAAGAILHRNEYSNPYADVRYVDGIKICLLLFALNITIGSLYVNSEDWIWITANVVLLGVSVAAVCSIIFMINDENRRSLMHRKLELLAHQDNLTQLPNYRSFALIASQVLQVKRIAVLMIDIDHFKTYNDYLGHLQGDQLLRDVGQVLKSSIGDMDYLARYGGEEFIVFTQTYDKARLSELAHNLCTAVSSYAFPYKEVQPNGRISVSVGISAAMSADDDLTRIIHEADQALYASKHRGRNTYCFYSDLQEHYA